MCPKCRGNPTITGPVSAFLNFLPYCNTLHSGDDSTLAAMPLLRYTISQGSACSRTRLGWSSLITDVQQKVQLVRDLLTLSIFSPRYSYLLFLALFA